MAREVEELKASDLDAIIEHEFSGLGVAVRREGDPAILDEPFIPMADAKDIVRRVWAMSAALARRSLPSPEAGGGEPLTLRQVWSGLSDRAQLIAVLEQVFMDVGRPVTPKRIIDAILAALSPAPEAGGAETVEIDGRQYRKFIRHPGPVEDGTVRCIACGQIDEPAHHDDALCPTPEAGEVIAELRDMATVEYFGPELVGLLNGAANLAERQASEIERLKEEADEMSTQIYESLPKYEVNDLLATKDAENARLREIASDYARHPCETLGLEDLEPGCCGPCRARSFLNPTKGAGA